MWGEHSRRLGNMRPRRPRPPPLPRGGAKLQFASISIAAHVCGTHVRPCRSLRAGAAGATPHGAATVWKSLAGCRGTAHCAYQEQSSACKLHEMKAQRGHRAHSARQFSCPMRRPKSAPRHAPHQPCWQSPSPVDVTPQTPARGVASADAFAHAGRLRSRCHNGRKSVFPLWPGPCQPRSGCIVGRPG
jgi:hypothetical protein